VLLGNATPLGGFRTVQYQANAPDTIIIRATVDKVDGDSPYTTAAPVDLILQVSGDSGGGDGGGDSGTCSVLPPTVGTVNKPLDAPTIVNLLGNPTPFLLAAKGQIRSLSIPRVSRSSTKNRRLLPRFSERSVSFLAAQQHRWVLR
jgi:hypothetical protein